MWDLPAELFEPRPVAEVLTHDDLLDFHLALEDERWLAEAMDTLQRG